MIVTYTPKAEAHLKDLSKNVSVRILEKIRWFCEQKDPLEFAEPLSGTEEKLYRFRIGNYRAIFMIKEGVPTIVMVLAVQHRSKAYR